MFAIVKNEARSCALSNNAGSLTAGISQNGSVSAASSLTSPLFYKNGVIQSITTRADMFNAYDPAWALLTIKVNTSTMTEYRLGFPNTFSMFNMSEVFIYHRDMTSEKAALEARLMTDYGII